MNNSEEDGLSDIVDIPEAALVMKPKPYSSSSQNSEELKLPNSSHLSGKPSPKKVLKRANFHNKRPILDQNNPSSLQSYYEYRKKQRKFVHNSEANSSAFRHANEVAILNTFEEFDKQNLLMVSLFLPIKVKLIEEKFGEFSWEIMVEFRDFASNLLNSLLANSSRSFLWLGILKTTEPIPFDKQDSLRILLREKYRCVAIFYDLSDLNKIKQDFFLNYLDYCLNFNLPRNSSKLFNYDEQLYLHYYKGLMRIYSSEISLISLYHSNPLIYILNYELFGLPSILKFANESLRIFFHWGLSFLNDDNFSCLPFGLELLNSLLSCNLVIFNTFQEAKPFFAIIREKTGLDYSSNNGLLYISYMARIIAIRVSNSLLDCELFSQVSQNERLWDLYWKEALEGHELIVSIDDSDRNPALLLLKLKLIEALASQVDLFAKNPNKRVKFLEIYTSNQSVNPQVFVQLKSLAKDINERLAYECVFLIETEIPEVIENALLTRTKFLLETQIFETSACKIQRFLSLTKNTGIILIPGSFEAWISSQTSNYCSFHHLSPQDFANKVSYLLRSPAIESLVKKEKFDTMNPSLWLEDSFEDFLISSNLKPFESSLFPRNSVSDPIRLPSKRVSLPSIAKLALDRKNKLIFFGFEEVLITKEAFTYIKDDFDQSVRKILKKPSDGLLESLLKLSSNSNCTVYIITGRGLDLLGYWFIDLENLGFANEYGFLHKDPGAKVWQRLFEMDWNWKDIVKKIMENYTAKTPGSLLEIKESCVIWKFEHADFELGFKQAEALIGHLNEVFENNSEIDVIKLDRAVEVRPLGLNKGTLIEMLIEKVCKEKGKIDMVVNVGGMLSDEDMFTGVSGCLKNYKEFFVRFFTDEKKRIFSFFSIFYRRKTWRF